MGRAGAGWINDVDTYNAASETDLSWSGALRGKGVILPIAH